MPADVLADAEEVALGREEARGMETAGRFERDLCLSQLVREGRDDVRVDVQIALDARRFHRDGLERAFAAHPARRARVEGPLQRCRAEFVGRHLDRVRRQILRQGGAARCQSLREAEAERELLVVTGSAHRDSDGLAVDPDLERLLDGDRVALRPSAGEPDDVDRCRGVGRRFAHADSVPLMDEWLRSARDAIAAAAGVPAAELELAAGEERMLLDLARVAAHTSGERTNAPLVCYLIGLAAAKGHAGLDSLADAVTAE